MLRRVVAITFTETATAEMASRVSAAFEDVRRGRLPVGVEESALPPRGVREERAAAFRLALDQLRVHTIHAFCYRLLLRYPLEAGVHPRLQVDADGQAVAAVAREVIEEKLPVVYGDSEDPDWALLADAHIGPRELEATLATLLGEGVAPADLVERPDRVATFAGAARPGTRSVRGASRRVASPASGARPRSPPRLAHWARRSRSLPAATCATAPVSRR